MGKVSEFKFGVRIDHQACKPKNAKVGQKGVGYIRRPTFIIFVPPAMSMERLNMQTSNLVHRLTTRGIYKKCRTKKCEN